MKYINMAMEWVKNLLYLVFVGWIKWLWEYRKKKSEVDKLASLKKSANYRFNIVKRAGCYILQLDGIDISLDSDSPTDLLSRMAQLRELYVKHLI